MSSVKRIVSASLASWVLIGVTVLNQLALVPVFLKYWSVAEYGAWLTGQSLLTLLTFLTFGYKTYWEFEFLRAGNSDRLQSAINIYSIIPSLLILGLIELLVALGLHYFGILVNAIFRDHVILGQQVGLLLIAQSVGWILFVCVPGVIQRGIVPYGYFAGNAWWYVLGNLVTIVSVFFAVIFGANVLQAGLCQIFGYSIFSVALYVRLFKILKKENLVFRKLIFSIGFKSIRPSFYLSGKTLLTVFQQQGVRLLLGGIVGLKELASFSTMRTINNVAFQGVGTVINPIIPEFVRLKNSGEMDNKKFSEFSSGIWLVTTYVLGVVLVLLQVAAPYLYEAWTRGKLLYDPFFFGLLSSGLLFYGLAQPFYVVIRGLNIIKPQFFSALISVILIVISIIVFTKYLGLIVVGVAVLLGEVLALFIYKNASIKVGKFLFPRTGILAYLITIINVSFIFLMSFFREIWMLLFLLFIMLSTMFAVKLFDGISVKAKEKIKNFTK